MAEHPRPLHILEDVRRRLIDHVAENGFVFNSGLTIAADYDVLAMSEEMLAARALGDCDIHGCAMIRVERWSQARAGVKVALDRTVDFIAIRLRDAQDAPLPLGAILHTFLHELAHTVTIPEQHLSRKMTRQTKRLQPTVTQRTKFVPNHHTCAFYCNFAKILRMSDFLGIYTLPKTHRNFSPKCVQRYDTMINPSDGMSIGTSRIYSYI